MLLRMMRGANAAGITAAECRAMTPAVLLKIHKARTAHGGEVPCTPGWSNPHTEVGHTASDCGAPAHGGAVRMTQRRLGSPRKRRSTSACCSIWAVPWRAARPLSNWSAMFGSICRYLQYQQPLQLVTADHDSFRAAWRNLCLVRSTPASMLSHLKPRALSLPVVQVSPAACSYRQQAWGPSDPHAWFLYA